MYTCIRVYVYTCVYVYTSMRVYMCIRLCVSGLLRYAVMEPRRCSEQPAAVFSVGRCRDFRRLSGRQKQMALGTEKPFPSHWEFDCPPAVVGVAVVVHVTYVRIICVAARSDRISSVLGGEIFFCPSVVVTNRRVGQSGLDPGGVSCIKIKNFMFYV